MKKFLFIFNTLSSGGAERSVIDIINYLVENYFMEITVFVIEPSNTLKPLISNKIKVVYVDSDNVSLSNMSKLKRFHLASKSLLKLLGKYKFDNILVIHEGIPELFIFYFSLKNVKSYREYKKKLVLIIHSSPLNLKYFYKKKMTLMVFYFLYYIRKYIYTRFVTISNKIKNDLKFVSKDKIKVIYNAINIKEIIALSKLKIHEKEISENKPFFLFLGRIHHVKNIFLLLEAFNKIKGKINSNLVIIGPNRDQMKYNSIVNFIFDNKLENRIKILDDQPNPYPFILNSSAVVNTSLTESFSIVLHEAMLLKVPTLTVKFDGYEEFFSSNSNILVNYNIDEFANQLIQLTDNRKSFDTQIDNAFRKSSKFDIEIIGKKYAEFLNAS